MISENTAIWASLSEKSLLQIACFSANPFSTTPSLVIDESPLQSVQCSECLYSPFYKRGAWTSRLSEHFVMGFPKAVVAQGLRTPQPVLSLRSIGITTHGPINFSHLAEGIITSIAVIQQRGSPKAHYFQTGN